jgi:dihydroorotase-like cyclic amidohydrolase
VRAASLVSRSKNTPFDGWRLRGAVAATLVRGRVVYTNPDIVPGLPLAGSATDDVAGRSNR